MKKSHTNLILIISTILFIFTIGSFVFFFTVIKNKNRHISAVSIALGKKTSEQINVNNLDNKIIELGNIQKRISGYFINTSAIDTFVEYLEGIGLSNNVDLSVKSVDTPKNEKNRIFVTINMKGSFSNLMRVISILENAPYNIIINSTYLNKETLISTDTNNTPIKGKDIPKEDKSYWIANVTFGILNL